MALRIKKQTLQKAKVKAKKKKSKKKTKQFEGSSSAPGSDKHGGRREIPPKNTQWSKRGYDLMPPGHDSVDVLLTTKDGKLEHTVSYSKVCRNCSRMLCPDKVRDPTSNMSCIVGLGLNSWEDGKVALRRGWWKPLESALTIVLDRDKIQQQIDIEQGKLSAEPSEDEKPKKKRRGRKAKVVKRVTPKAKKKKLFRKK